MVYNIDCQHMDLVVVKGSGAAALVHMQTGHCMMHSAHALHQGLCIHVQNSVCM